MDSRQCQLTSQAIVRSRIVAFIASTTIDRLPPVLDRSLRRLPPGDPTRFSVRMDRWLVAGSSSQTQMSRSLSLRPAGVSALSPLAPSQRQIRKTCSMLRLKRAVGTVNGRMAGWQPGARRRTTAAIECVPRYRQGRRTYCTGACGERSIDREMTMPRSWGRCPTKALLSWCQFMDKVRVYRQLHKCSSRDGGGLGAGISSAPAGRPNVDERGAPVAHIAGALASVLACFRSLVTGPGPHSPQADYTPVAELIYLALGLDNSNT